LLALLTLTLVACNKDDDGGTDDPIISEPTPGYSFFVAGHTYGNAVNFQFGLHPPVKEHFAFINDYPAMRFGVLTGDVVPAPSQEYWDAALVDLSSFTMPIHVAAGNHDRGPVFESIYQHDYYSFQNGKDLFIILNPTSWNIQGDQKAFLEQTLADNAEKVNNIFLFCHELIWWAPDSIFGNVEINYRPHYPGSTNFWPEIHPILDALPNNVVFFAGDLGATAEVDHYTYFKKDNVTLIGTGMGGGSEDNIVVVEVHSPTDVRFKLLGINADTPYELGILEDYILP